MGKSKVESREGKKNRILGAAADGTKALGAIAVFAGGAAIGKYGPKIVSMLLKR